MCHSCHTGHTLHWSLLLLWYLLLTVLKKTLLVALSSSKVRPGICAGRAGCQEQVGTLQVFEPV